MLEAGQYEGLEELAAYSSSPYCQNLCFGYLLNHFAFEQVLLASVAYFVSLSVPTVRQVIIASSRAKSR